MGLILVALLFGHEVKGSRRWIFGIQPSEFLKPAFVILVAWAFSEGGKRRDVPGTMIAILLWPLTVIPLMLQPDFGQTMLVSLVWMALVLHGRAALVLGVRARRLRHVGRDSSPTSSCRTCARAS